MTGVYANRYHAKRMFCTVTPKLRRARERAVCREQGDAVAFGERNVEAVVLGLWRYSHASNSRGRVQNAL